MLCFCSIFFFDHSHAQESHAIGPPPEVSIQSPLVMVSFGDSITAGAFANTAADLPLSFIPSIANLANLSILFNQNLKETAVENKQLWSWASGVGINSHYNHLKNYLNIQNPNELQVINMAVSGSVGYDLLLQVKKFAAAVSLKPETQIAYITMLIGANDTCDGITPEETYSELKQAFDILSSIPQKNKIRILISSLPQIYKLGEPAIRDHATGTFALSCEVIRSQMLKFCNSLTHWNNQAEYQSHINKVETMNGTLSKIANDAVQLHSNLDIQFSSALYQQDLNFELLASDCFHPNIKGQGIISEALWNDQPWFK